jgi:invasion protein IalB
LRSAAQGATVLPQLVPTQPGMGLLDPLGIMRAASRRMAPMTARIASASVWPRARAFSLALTATALAVVIGFPALAQAPPPAQPLPKAQPKPLPKAPPPPNPAPAVTPAQTGAAPTQLIYSSWSKACMKGQEPNAQQICFTGKEGFIGSGMLVIAAALIEAQGTAKKILRVTLPLGMQLAPGTRAVVDQGQPMNAPYVICFPNGCIADYEASDELVGKMKKGQGLMVQGVDGQGQQVNLGLPLSEFAKAYDGPATDQNELQKRQQEMQKRLEDARKKWESEQPAAPH